MKNPISDKIADKIAKLLALAEGGANEAECQSAWIKVQAMAAEHQLDLEALRLVGQAPAAEMTNIVTKKPDATWKVVLLNTICKANACKLLTGQNNAYVLGETDDVSLVMGMYERIVKQIRHFARVETAARGQKAKGSWETAYRTGMAQRVGQRITEAAKSVQADVKGSTALVLARDTRVDDYALAKFGPTRAARSRRQNVNAGAYSLGHQRGDKVQIHTAIKG